MNTVYERDLDLNLLRVFAVVAECGSVTEAAARLYLTQPAVSAALRRLTTAVGAPLFVRSGRGLVLTSRGRRLAEAVRPHLHALVDATRAPASFDPATCDRTLRLGVSDTVELWLLPDLLRALAREAPNVRIIAVPVQFRTVGAELAAGLDAAVTVADALPASIHRRTLYEGGFVCLFDPAHGGEPPRTEAAYFARDHVIVSYNGDLRGIVEDQLGRQRRIRCSLSRFATLGAVLDGTDLIATVPLVVAHQIRRQWPALRILPVPLPLTGSAMELLWPAATDDDPACRFLRDHVERVARAQLAAVDDGIGT